jgi:acetyltransferase-like isoleucine patch superfamily enzyme
VDGYNLAKGLRDVVGTALLRPSFAACGRHSYIAFPVRIVGRADHIRIGSRVLVGPDSLIWVGEDGSVALGDDCRITSGIHLSAADRITLCRSVLIARNVSIIDNQHRSDDATVPIMDQGLARIAPVEIREGAWLGSNSVILPGVTVGRNAVVGANAVVVDDVPDGATVVGAPARVIGRRIDSPYSRPSRT